MKLLNIIIKSYQHLTVDMADKRTNSWILISSPVPLFIMVACYLYFCLSFGPRYMKDRQPYKLKAPIMAYNIFQIMLNAYLSYEGFIFIITNITNLSCMPLEYADDPYSILKASCAWWYFIAKVTELLDTTFFVLRKKYNQVTTIHVYHHSLMALMSWIFVKYFADGQALMLGILNAMVHTLMYTYYLIAALGPQYQKYLWWKKHLTAMQIVQFSALFIHNLIPLFTDCNFPKWMNLLIVTNCVIFIYSFGNIFYKNYVAPHNAGVHKKHSIKTD